MAYGEHEDLTWFEDVTCHHETEKAIFVKIDGQEYIIPKSQVSDDSEVYKEGTSGKLVITVWIAEKKGLKGLA